MIYFILNPNPTIFVFMNMQLDEQYWQNRYLNKDTGWDIGCITSPLKEYIDHLTDQQLHILIPGAGNSYEAEYLWQKGFKNVYVADFASQPLENIKTRVPDFPSDQLLHKDFFQLEMKFDLILEQTFFCALNPSLRKNYAAKMHELLKPGGKLAGLLFNDTLNTDKPPFGGNKEEYISYFRPLFRIIHFEECYNSIAPRAGRELFIELEKAK